MILEKLFRSRGVRFIKKSFAGYGKSFAKVKIYYEPDFSILKCHRLSEMMNKGILEYFEYSENESGNIDTFNFHNNLNIQSDEIYQDLSVEQLQILKKVPYFFDQTFLNYTIGYKVDEEKIIGKNYYFYPTIKKENGYGIKGITERTIIEKYIGRFAYEIGINDMESEDEIKAFSGMIYKFKGISIAFTINKLVEYKIYGRILSCDIYKFLSDKVEIDSDSLEKFGDVVLVAQRIRNKCVVGYNLYYLS